MTSRIDFVEILVIFSYNIRVRGYSIMAIMPPFQGGDTGSIPVTRSRKLGNFICALSSVGLERLVSAQKVGGSSPSGRTKIIDNY